MLQRFGARDMNLFGGERIIPPFQHHPIKAAGDELLVEVPVGRRKLNIRCSQLARMLSVRRIERFAVPCAIFPLRVAFAPEGGHGVFGHGLQLIPDPCFLIPSPFLNEARRHQIQWALTGSR